MSDDRLKALADAGVSIWLDDLSRERIETGNLAELVAEKHVVGVTTNPTIFAAAIADGERYDEQVRYLVAEGADVDAGGVRADHRGRPQRLRHPRAGRGRHRRRRPGLDRGRADPRQRHRRDHRLGAKALWAAVDRPNVLIKIPATLEGLPAITAAIAEGISVNVTLIFSTERYQAVMDAYLTGLEQAQGQRHRPRDHPSVASFFVSRVDTEIDPRLDEIGTDEALALRGKAAVANARLAYAAFEEVIASTAGRRSPRPAPTRSVRCGRRPA